MPQKMLPDGTLQLDGIILDLRNREVTGANGTHRLAAMECRLLKVFMQRPGQIVPRAVLMKTVWNTDYLGDTRTLDVHICMLRKKIEKDPRRPRLLRTERGLGYRFVPG